MTTKSYSSMGLSGEERGYTEKRIRAGEKPAPTIKPLCDCTNLTPIIEGECAVCDCGYKYEWDDVKGDWVIVNDE